MQKTLKTRWLTVIGTATLLAACGGGGSTTTPAGPTLVMGTDVPVTVEQSAAGLVDFAKTQLAATSESSEPLDLGEAKLAIDDSAEPAEI